MDKIYSRKRIKIPSIKPFFTKPTKPNKKAQKFKTIAIIIIIALITASIIIQAINPIFDTICENEAKAIATKISNEQATIVMSNYKYEDLVEVIKDNQGNISLIKSNIIPINEITSDIALKIQEELKKDQNSNIPVPIGGFTGIKLFSGIGPKINIKLASIGNVETDLRSEFISKGINQTLHKIYLQVICKVSILTPYNTIQTEITNQVLLAEAVIVGNVPNSYYNLEGLEKRDAVELIE